MANSNSTQVSGTKSVSYKTTDLAGLYAYRFNGFAISNNILQNLVGVGQFEIKRNGALSGHHKSSITAMQGSAKLHTGSYDLTGTISLPANGKGMGSASVKFKKKRPVPAWMSMENSTYRWPVPRTAFGLSLLERRCRSGPIKMDRRCRRTSS
jgi:hypothetical protein